MSIYRAPSDVGIRNMAKDFPEEMGGTLIISSSIE